MRWRRLTGTAFFMMIVSVILVAALFTGLAIALTIPSPAARNDLIRIPTAAPPPPSSTTTSVTGTSVTGTTVPGITTAPGTTAPGVTTTPTIAVNITCPASVSVVLGATLEPAFTGGFAVAGGGCTTPVVQYTDTHLGFLSKKKKKKKLIPEFEEEKDMRWYEHHDGHLMPGNVMMTSTSPTLLSSEVDGESNSLDVHYDGPAVEIQPRGQGRPGDPTLRRPVSSKAALRKMARSPSFNTTNLLVIGTPLTVSNTGVTPPDSTAAVSPDHVVMGVNHGMGTLVTVTNKNTALLSSFLMSSLGTGNCSGTTRGDPQIMWDHEAERWVLLELGVAGSNVLCVYLSDTSDPVGMYSGYEYSFDPYFPDFPKIGLWRRAYLLTFNMAPAHVGDDPANMCVINREEMLNFVPSVNVTAPRILCAASLLGRLSGFGFQAWTPISAEGGPMPPQETEAANAPGIGAVFFRHLDDELHKTGGTPTVDFLQVEHWSNINWTQGTFGALRYQINIADFDSSFSGCVSSDECIPTPTSQQVDPVREVLNNRLSYRYIPETGQESLVGTFTSHANGTATARVRWFELRWAAAIPMSPKSWLLHQEGTLPWQDGVHRWMGAISMDGNGTILLGYSASSAAVYPSLLATSRLRNDPEGEMRTPLLLRQGDTGSVISSNRWGDYASVSIDPTQSRIFYVTGQASSNTFPWNVQLTALRILG